MKHVGVSTRCLLHGVCLGLVLLPFAGFGQPISLVSDLRTAPNPYYVSPSNNMTAVGSRVFFVAASPGMGSELWVSDGTTAGTRVVKDIRAGAESSGPNGFTNVGGTVFFSADDGTHGVELWKSDGTEAGTVLVKDAEVGPGGSFPNYLATNGSVLFYSYGGPAQELWRSDGTEAGTYQLKDIPPTWHSSQPRNLAWVGGALYFSASDPDIGQELWKSDGTATGTILVKDLWPGGPGSGVRNLTDAGGVVFFVANDGASGEELWRTDGTPSGTTLVADVNPGAAGSSPQLLTNVGGTLFFTANDGTNGTELWKSDGTPGGTTLVKDLCPGCPSNVGNLVAMGGVLYFTASDGVNGRELWRSDGTEAGTVRVTDLCVGGMDGVTGPLVVLAGKVYFPAGGCTASGNELWSSDGTTAGTAQVKEICPGGCSSGPGPIVAATTSLYFGANDGTNGGQLWKSDGSDAGTVRVTSATVLSSFPNVFVDLGGTLVFTAADPTANTRTLWKSDGTAAGTAQLAVGRLYNPRAPVLFGGRAFFSGDSGGGNNELWASDGTEAGTILVKEIRPSGLPSNPSFLTPAGPRLYFAAVDGTSGTELWASDGTETGTILVKDIWPGGSWSNPQNLTAVGGRVFFTADDGVNGRELWVSDGTEAGTTLVKDVSPGGGGSNPGHLAEMGGVLYFSATDPTGNWLYRSDGTAAGTYEVTKHTCTNPMYQTRVGGTLFFTGWTSTGWELCASDGTSAGTRMVRKIYPGGSSSPSGFVAVGSFAYFRANDGVTGTELWRSDGTEAGTWRLADIRPGSGSSLPRAITPMGGAVYFVANDGVHGEEIWKSTGSNEGTFFVQDLNPGTAHSEAGFLTPFGARLVLSGDDGTIGLEPRIIGTAALSVTKTASTPAPTQGSSVTWTITVSNAGPLPATGLRVIDPLPIGAIFVSSSPGSPTCTITGGTLTCLLGTLASGASTVVTVTATVAVGFTGDLSNTARAVALQADAEGGNDFATVVVTVPGPQPVTGLYAQPSSATSIALTWNDPSSTQTGIRIERSTDGSTFLPLTTVGPHVTAYADLGLTPGALYFYRVVAVQSGVGEAVPSNVAAAQTYSDVATKVCATKVGPEHQWSRFPAVAWNGTTWAVAMQVRNSEKDLDEIRFQRLDAATGLPTGAPVNLSDDDMNSSYPTIRWNGTRHAVVWYTGMRTAAGAQASSTAMGLLDGSGALVRVNPRIADGGAYINDNAETALAWNGSEWGVVLPRIVGTQSDLYFTRVSAAGDAVGASVRLTETPEMEIDVSLAWNGSVWGVSWVRRTAPQRVWFQRLQADGAPLGTPTLVYENVAGTDVLTTSLVWDGTGWAVAWDDVGPGPGYSERITLARLNADGSPNGAPVSVSPEYDPDFPPEEQVPNYDSVPQLFAKPGGGYVVFTSATLNTNYFLEIGRYETDASGNRIGGRTILSANDDHYSVYSRAAFDGTKYLVAYNDGASSRQEVARFVAAASGPALLAPALLTGGASPGDTWGVASSGSPVALATGKRFTLVWTEPATATGSRLHATVVDASGAVTSNRWPLTTRETRTRPGAVATGTSFALAWKDPNDDVWFDRYDANGSSLLGEVLVAPMQYGRPAVGVAFSGEAYGVAWIPGANLCFQRVSPSGALLGARTSLALPSTPTTTPLQIAWTGTGWAVVYTRGTRLEYVLLDRSGSVSVGPVAISATSNAKGALSAAWSGSRLAVAWVESTGSPSLLNDVLFTVVAPNGVPDFAPVAAVSSAWNDGNPSLYWAGDRFGLVHSFGEYPVLREVGLFPNGSFASSPRLLNPRGGANAAAWNGATLGVVWPQQADLYFETTECLADTTPPSCPSVSAVRTGQEMTISIGPGADAESGVFRNYLYRDGVLLAELFPETTTVRDGGLLPGVAPTYEARAMNGAWLESAGCTTIKPSTDLAATISDAPDPVAQVQNVTYTATATNTGLSPATAVVLTVTIPTQATFQSSSPGSPTCAHSAGTVTCSLGGLAPGAASSVNVVVRPKAGTAGAIVATASADGAEGDPNAANDSASATTTVLAPAPARDLVVTARTTTTVSLAWTDPQGGETAFRVERSADGTSFTAINNLGPDVATYVDTGRSPATLYSYRVVAVQNLVGEAPPSNVAATTTFASTAAKVCATPLGPFAGNASGPTLAWTGTSWAAAWTDRRDGLAEEVWFQRLDAATLAPIGSAVRVSQTGAPSGARALRWNGSKLGLLWQESMKRPDGANVYDYRFTAFDAAGNRLQGDVPAFRLEARATHGPAEVPLLWNGTGWGAFVLENPAFPNDIRYYRLDANGRPVGAPVAVTATSDWEVALSVAWSGTEYGVAFSRTGLNGGAYQILLQRMAVDGTLLGAPAVVWENTSLGEGEFLSGTTSVAWDGAAWVVAFTDIGPLPDQAEAVWLRRVSAAGVPSGAAVRLSPAFDPDMPPEDQAPVIDQTPTILPKAGGGFVVLTSSWLNTTRYREVCRYEANASLARVGTRIVVSTGDTRNSPSPRAATDGTRALVAWNEGRSGTPEVAAALLDAAGGTLVAPTEITGGHTLGYSGNPVALALGSGFGALYTYQDASLAQTSIGGAFWNGSGSLVATRTPLSARGIRGAPGAAAAGSSFAVAWKDFANNVAFARYDATGAPVGSETVVATGAGGRPYVGIAFGGDSYGLAYWSGANLYLHRVAPDGTTLGVRALVTTTTENGAPGPQVQWVGSGWAIVWLQETHLFYARLDAAGAVVVPPIQVTFTPQTEAAYQLYFTGQHLGLAWHEYAVPDPPGGEVFFTVLGLDGIKAFPPIAIGSSDLDDYYPSISWDVDRFRVVMVPNNPGVLREIPILPNGTVPPGERMLWNAGGLNSVAWNGATLGLAWQTGGYIHFQTTACLADASAPPCPAATAVFDGAKTTVAWAPVTDADSGLWRYDVYRDGLLVAEERSGTTSWVDTAPPPGVAHAYGVRALNKALLESAACATASPAANLGVTIADAPDPVAPGGAVTYTLTVSNAGPSAASGVSLVDTLPAGVTFSSSSPSSPDCAHAAGVVTCALGTIASGANRVVTIVVTLDPGTSGTLTNTASVTGVEDDPVPANDNASSTTAVTVLAQTLTVTRDGAGTGSVFSNPLGISCGATCVASFAPGAVVALTPVPNAGSTFTGWSGACTGAGACSVTMSAARAVNATFALAPVLPAITSFTATPSVRTSAGTSTLAWTTTGATSVAISGLGGTFALSGTRDVSVAATTTYTLTATNAAGSVTATTTVNVLPGAGTSLGTPVITAPSAGQVVTVAGVGFTWNAVSSAAGYDVKLYSATSGATVFAGSLVGNASTSTLVTLPDGAYLFAVRACNASGFANANCGAFATRSFSVAKTSPTGAPTVTAPAQGAVLTASTQTFSWTSVPKVDPGLSLSYEVLLTDVAGGNIPDLQITVPDPTLSTIYTLHSSALYELKVRACQAGCGPWSAPVTFSVDLPDVPTTAPSIPTCSVSGGNSLTCSWSAVSGADVYSFYVVQPTGGPGGGALTVAARLVSTTTVTLPVPQGFANVIVAACTGDGCGPWSGARGINPAGPNPSSPNLGTPLAASVVNGPGVEFSWNRIPGDDGTNTWYRLYVQDLSRQAAALDVYTRDNFYAAYFKAEGARYDALVVANPGASQVVGPPIGFNVRGLSASAPTMVSPPHQSQVQAGNLQLGWSPVPGATLYQYWVAVLGQGTPAVTGVTPGLVVQVPLPAVNGQPTTYSGITRACMAPTGCSPTSDTGWGPWSNAPGGPGVTNFTVVP